MWNGLKSFAENRSFPHTSQSRLLRLMLQEQALYAQLYPNSSLFIPPQSSFLIVVALTAFIGGHFIEGVSSARALGPRRS